MDMAVIVDLIKSVGFPIAITLYVLIRLEKSMKDVSDSVRDLTIKITELCTYTKAKLEDK